MNKVKTNIVIRPAARGGKYLGHDAANIQNNSALVALMDIATGKFVSYGLANAPTKQSAGPENLMEPVSRATPFATDGETVEVALSVEIAEPTTFRVMVFGPLKHPDQARLAQADITVLPGVDIGINNDPEGIVIEVPGLCISNVAAELSGPQLSCNAVVTMMCGCPIGDPLAPSWPASDFSIQLMTMMKSGKVYSYTLESDTSSSVISSFKGTWTNQASAEDTVEQAWLYASEAKLGNQGSYKLYPTPIPFMPLPPELQGVLSEAEKA